MLLGLGAATLAFLLAAYLFLIPSIGSALPIWPFVWSAVAFCFVGSAVLTYQTSSAERTQISRSIRSFFVAVAITVIVLFCYLVIATILRGA